MRFQLKQPEMSLKQHLARTLLEWETAWEILVLMAWVWISVLVSDERTESNSGHSMGGFVALISGRASLDSATDTNEDQKGTFSKAVKEVQSQVEKLLQQTL